MASSRIYIPGVIRVACGNKVGRSVLLPASSSSHPLSSSSSLSAWYSAGILLGLLIVPNPAPLDQTRHQAMGGGDIAVPCYLGPRYKSGDGGTIKANPCVLAILKGSFDPVSPFIRQTIELRITKVIDKSFVWLVLNSYDQDTLTSRLSRNWDPWKYRTDHEKMRKRAKDIENITFAEYMEYEAELKKQSRRSTRLSRLKRYEGSNLNSSHREKNIALEYPHYSDDTKIYAYYDLPPLLPCYQHVQPHINYDHKPPYVLRVSRIAWLLTNQIGTKKDKISALRKPLVNGSKWKSKTQIDALTKKCQEEGTKEVSRSSVSECRAIYANNDSPTNNTLSDETNELHEASFTADLEDAQDEKDVLSKNLAMPTTTQGVEPREFYSPLHY
ncbi:hypothetical protein Tco_1292050 [Tanacetum coccineum]